MTGTFKKIHYSNGVLNNELFELVRFSNGDLNNKLKVCSSGHKKLNLNLPLNYVALTPLVSLLLSAYHSVLKLVCVFTIPLPV